MKLKVSTYTITLIFTLIATILLCVLRTMALLLEFDSATSYYNHDAMLPSLYMWGAFIIIAINAALVVYMRRDLQSIKVTSESSVIIFIAALLGFIIFAGTLLDFFISGIEMTFLSQVALVLSIPAALYCLIGIALPIGNNSAEIVLSMLFIMWLFLTLIGIYFDITIEVNNPGKVLTLSTLAVSLIFFISEARYRVAEPRAWLFTLSGITTVIFSGLYALPNALLLIMKQYPDSNISITREMVILGIFAYTVARLFITAPSVGQPMEDEGLDNSMQYYDEESEDDVYYDDADNAGSTHNDSYGTPQKRSAHRRLSEYDMYGSDDGR